MKCIEKPYFKIVSELPERFQGALNPNLTRWNSARLSKTKTIHASPLLANKGSGIHKDVR